MAIEWEPNIVAMIDDDCTELGIILNDSWIGSSGSQQWISEFFGTRITGKHLGTPQKDTGI